MKYLTPPETRPPFGNYVHGVEVPPGARIVMTSGQLGVGPDDVVPEDVEAQARLCFDNVRAVLRAAGMDMSDVVRLNAYVTDRAHFPVYMAVRDEYVGTPPPASTLVIVSGFTREDFAVEVEATAAKLD